MTKKESRGHGMQRGKRKKTTEIKRKADYAAFLASLTSRLIVENQSLQSVNDSCNSFDSHSPNKNVCTI